MQYGVTREQWDRMSRGGKRWAAMSGYLTRCPEDVQAEILNLRESIDPVWIQKVLDRVYSRTAQRFARLMEGSAAFSDSLLAHAKRTQ